MWRKGDRSVRAAAGVPVSQDLATGCMTDIFLSLQHCHGNHHSEFYDFSETKISFNVTLMRFREREGIRCRGTHVMGIANE